MRPLLGVMLAVGPGVVDDVGEFGVGLSVYVDPVKEKIGLGTPAARMSTRGRHTPEQVVRKLTQAE